MESIDALKVQLKELGSKIKESIESALVLNTLFADKEIWLHREDAVAALQVLLSSTCRQADNLREKEASERYADARVSSVFSIGGLAAMGAGMAFQNKKAINIGKLVIRTTTTREKPFGRVLICIGPEGIPGGVEAISISSLARKSKRQEYEIIQDLEMSGHLLVTEKVFAGVIGILAASIRKGQAVLPISRDKLSELITENQAIIRVRRIGNSNGGASQ